MAVMYEINTHEPASHTKRNENVHQQTWGEVFVPALRLIATKRKPQMSIKRERISKLYLGYYSAIRGNELLIIFLLMYLKNER